MQRHRFPIGTSSAVLGALFLTSLQGASNFTKGQTVAPFTPSFRPGDYVWRPEISPAGPIVIIISIPDQLMFVYRNGVRIGRSSVSTGKPGETPAVPGGFHWTPEKAPSGPVSIIVSAADRTVFIYRNGVQIGRTAIGGLERLAGSYVYSALAKVDSSGRRDWISTASLGGRPPNLKELVNRVVIAPEFLADARALVTPGTTLVLTDAPVSGRTHSAPGFNILTTSANGRN